MLDSEMQARFVDNGTASDILLLIPSCVIDSKWRNDQEEWEGRVTTAVEVYHQDSQALSSIMLSTELNIWRDYW